MGGEKSACTETKKGCRQGIYVKHRGLQHEPLEPLGSPTRRMPRFGIKESSFGHSLVILHKGVVALDVHAPQAAIPEGCNDARGQRFGLHEVAIALVGAAWWKVHPLHAGNDSPCSGKASCDGCRCVWLL